MRSRLSRSHRADVLADETRIPVQHKRVMRARFAAQLPQHLPAVMTVLAAGGSAIQFERTGGGLALAAVELLVGAWVLFTIAHEARHIFGRQIGHDADTAPEGEAGVDVPGLAAAALGYVEVWHHAVERGHFKLVSPYMVGATATLALALGGRRLIRHRMRHRRPHLLVTPTAVTYRGSRRRRWTAAWADVASVENGSGELVLHLRNGRSRVLRADDHIGGDHLIAAARDAVAAHAPARLVAAASVGGEADHGDGCPAPTVLSRR